MRVKWDWLGLPEKRADVEGGDADRAIHRRHLVQDGFDGDSLAVAFVIRGQFRDEDVCSRGSILDIPGGP